MSLLIALMEEHRLLLGVVDRLERALKREEDDVMRSEARRALLVLLPALDLHEEIESLAVLDKGAGRQGAKKVPARAAAEHRRVAALREQLRAAADMLDDEDWPQLTVRLAGFVRKLRKHFRDEEKGLWPAFETTARSGTAALERSTQRQVKRLVEEVKENWGAVSDYLGPKA